MTIFGEWQKIRDRFLAAVVCLLLVGPVSLMVAEKCGVDLPSWLTAEDSRYLSGGFKKTEQNAHCSFGGFVSGALQDDVAAIIENCVPMKAGALLGSAKLQYAAICISNQLFCWDVVPSFYGSEVLVESDSRRLLEMPDKDDTETRMYCERISDEINQLGATFSGSRFFVYFGMDSPYLDDSPSADLVSDALRYSTIEDIFSQNAKRYAWISGNVAYEDYNKLWYKNDHHWTVVGAYAAYCSISEAMGLSPVSISKEDYFEYEGLSFFGTLARRGLIDDWPDAVIDTFLIDAPVKEVVIDGQEATLDALHSQTDYWAGKWHPNRFANHYSELFHDDYGLVEVKSEVCNSGNSLLIVSDSYSNCMETLFAYHYDSVYVLDPRFEEESVASFLSTHQDVTDVLFLMRKAEFLSEATEKALAVS